MSYAETIDLLEKAPSDIKGKVDFNDEVLFTESIIKEINRFKSKEEASNSDNYTFVENHSIIDCTNRYKMDDGRFNFTIKLPAGTDTYAVTLEVTKNDQGEKLFSDHLMYFTGGIWNTSLRLIDSYDGSDYYELITDKSVNAGIGIKLYMNYDGASYMATNNADGSTVEGRGYWLSA